ncbi:hypothetical protein ABKN59_009365 [Abortiporus biennis]
MSFGRSSSSYSSSLFDSSNTDFDSSVVPSYNKCTKLVEDNITCLYASQLLSLWHRYDYGGLQVQGDKERPALPHYSLELEIRQTKSSKRVRVMLLNSKLTTSRPFLHPTWQILSERFSAYAYVNWKSLINPHSEIDLGVSGFGGIGMESTRRRVVVFWLVQYTEQRDSEYNLSGFDPIFYFHRRRCDIDRLCGLRVYIYVNIGNKILEKSQFIRFSAYHIGTNRAATQQTELVPFRRPDGGYWTSQHVKSLQCITDKQIHTDSVLDVKCSTRTVIINVHNPHRDKATENQLHDAAIQDLFSDFRPFFRGRRVCPTSNILSFRQIQPSIPDRSEVIKGIRGFTVVGGLVQDIIKMSHHLELYPCGALTR